MPDDDNTVANIAKVDWLAENCADLQNLIELEFYKHEAEGTSGPFYRWALGDVRTADPYWGLDSDLYGFFLDDLAMDPLKTCYLDMCEYNPCGYGQECVSTWDGTDAWYTCDGGNQSFPNTLYKSDYLILFYKLPSYKFSS